MGRLCVSYISLLFGFFTKRVLYYCNFKKSNTSFKKKSTLAQVTFLMSASHAAETNASCSLRSGMGLMGSLAHQLGLGWWSGRSLLPVPRSAALAHRETTTQDIRRDIQQETWAGLMIPSRGPAAQKGENHTRYAGEQPGLTGSVAM